MLARTAQAAAAAAVASRLHVSQAAAAESGAASTEVWDMHGHLTGVSGTPEERITQLLRYADRMGIDKVIFFLGFSRDHDPSPQQFRRDNDVLLRALDHARGRALGFVYLNPKFTDESLKELDRCVRDGPMVGVKLWVAIRCHDERLDPVVQRATDLGAVVFQHTWLKTTGNLPGESTPDDLAQLAARHPSAMLIAGHLGGNWQRGIRAIRAARNVYAGISGSDPTAGMVEMAVRELGAERVIYGSDFGGRSLASQLAKVHGADIPEEAKRLILGGNIRRLLRPILMAKGMTSP
jgi:predicted TIM-barrel fold metal-dependent hydrolase